MAIQERDANGKFKSFKEMYEALMEKYNRLEASYRQVKAWLQNAQEDAKKYQELLAKERKEHAALVEEMWQHMGWFRRWLWNIKHRE